MNKKTDRALAYGFIAALFSMSFAFVALPNQAFSETENRTLQSSPKLTWSNLWSKKFAEEAENYVTDHFPFRDRWVWMKSGLEQIRLQQENNGIYKGKDGYLFEKFAEPDYEKAAKYAEAIKRFAERNPQANATFVLAPTSIGVYAERLPWLASAYPQSKVNAYIANKTEGGPTFLNGDDFLSPDSDKPLYYRTDHHWTTYGAYLAYRAYAKEMGWKPKPESEFDIRTVTSSFLGSYHTKSQFSGLSPDSIQAYLPKQPVKTTAYVADTDETFDSLYAPEYLDKKDKYSYFLGGVHALMEIKTELAPEASSLDKLLVIKDSYAHSVIPFLTLHVPDIHVIDIRYYNGSIDGYMKEHGIRNVLLLFNTATFVDNASLLKLND
ncbi:DHHW family protein [Cohnella faecalis]|uniref:AlgX/AlgJ SGNH hydrolase-like domain-containing protein n=1 Tax=Cohnella faecalis TaxID=2315694 RepID=A0A398CY59_9BACL|nr:DHHW family protein [Cohnella faecalis]RIE04727.1 hypothetical protein D3H35_04385 [Cohnella faecalis]